MATLAPAVTFILLLAGRARDKERLSFFLEVISLAKTEELFY